MFQVTNSFANISFTSVIGCFISFCFLCAFNTSVHGQCQELRRIISSELSEKQKIKKIDSLFTNLEKYNSEKLGECYHDLGNRWYFESYLNSNSITQLKKAIINTEKAIMFKKDNKTDAISLRKSLYNLAYFQLENDSVYKAIKIYEEILSFNIPDDKDSATRIDLGLIYVEIGDFEKAIKILEEVLTNNKVVLNKLDFKLDTHILTADIYGMMDFKSYEKKIRHHLEKADSIIKIKNRSDSFQADQIRLYRGNLNLRTNNLSKAIKYYKIILRNNNFNPTEFARVNNNLGFCYIKKQDFTNAEKYLHKAISLDSLYSDPYENLGDLFVQKEDFKQGMIYYQQTLRLLTASKNLSNIRALPSDDDLELIKEKLPMLEHLIAKANGWIKYYEYDGKMHHLIEALRTFSLADKLIDIIRSESTEYQSKLYWREQSASLYVEAAKVCHLLKKPEKAYYFMERNKAVLLLEDLTNEEAKEIANIPHKKAQKEFDLKRAIFLSENKLQENIEQLSDDSLSALKKTILENKNRYEKFIDSLEKSYPQYAKFKRKADVFPFHQLKSNYLSENNATLHYILNEEDGYGLLTTIDTTFFFQLRNVQELNQGLEDIAAVLSSGVSDIDRFKKISNRVFKSLIPNTAYNHIKGKQLTIIPDFILQQIPFESLVTAIDELQYLFQEVEIGYAYSISLLQYNQKNGHDTATDMLAMAPKTFDSLKLQELYFSESEVRNIESVFPGEIFLNAQASKSNFIKNLANHSIVHLATHADIGDGDNPWIAFNDSKMYLKEIYGTKNHAEMVVLSACNTSNGELKRGEGVMSLARGFFYSGAKSVISTLWPVADESGRDILINFYKHLKKGLTKSKALQKAKLEYLDTTEEEELKHPYYWAGFVVLGDNSPVTQKPISPWLFLGPGILVTGMLFFGYKKIKAHRAAA